MKNIIIGMSATVILILSMLIIFTTFGRQIREAELNNGLNNAMKIAIEMLQEDPYYAPNSNEELVSDFLQAFFLHIDSSSNVTIEILDVDYTLGILSIRATSHYKHLTGTDGSVSVEKTIILEQFEKEDAVVYAVVTYMVEGKIYRCYELKAGERYAIPPEPSIEGKNFVGWKLKDDDIIYSSDDLASKTLTNDVTYLAYFN